MVQLSVISIGNSIQNYVTLHYTRRMYNGRFVPNPTLSRAQPGSGVDPEDSVLKLIPVRDTSQASSSTPSTRAGDGEDQVTPLAARLFGVYTLVVSVVRLYAAYNISSAPLYQLGVMTYVVAWAHFVSELAHFKTQRLGRPQLLPLGFASVGILWTLAQYSYYVKG